MKYAYKNGKILNGTKDMQVQTGHDVFSLQIYLRIAGKSGFFRDNR